MLRAWMADSQYQLGKAGKPVDPEEWGMTPQTVNAYYNPVRNEIVFPAAILQPPFFDMTADDAVNYGGIGGVIGHEMGHGFDDQGRRYDAKGQLRDWWTKKDGDEFTRRAKGLVAPVLGDGSAAGALKVNGELTLGENIGDLTGVIISHRAYELSLAGKEPPLIDGANGHERFFYGWVQAWRAKYRDDALRQQVLTNVARSRHDARQRAAAERRGVPPDVRGERGRPPVAGARQARQDLVRLARASSHSPQRPGGCRKTVSSCCSRSRAAATTSRERASRPSP